MWIFVLAGAFANSAKDKGSLELLTYPPSVLPDNMLLPGLFLRFLISEYRNER